MGAHSLTTESPLIQPVARRSTRAPWAKARPQDQRRRGDLVTALKLEDAGAVIACNSEVRTGKRHLCRRLDLGLMVIGGRGAVEVIEDPIPYRRRQSKRRSSLLLGEFERRQGDLNVGASNRAPIVTVYRQDALRCVRALATAGPMRLAELRVVSGVTAPRRSYNATSTTVSIVSGVAPTDLPSPARRR